MKLVSPLFSSPLMKNDEKTPDTTQTETFVSPFVPTVNIVGFNYEFISYSFFFLNQDKSHACT